MNVSRILYATDFSVASHVVPPFAAPPGEFYSVDVFNGSLSGPDDRY